MYEIKQVGGGRGWRVCGIPFRPALLARLSANKMPRTIASQNSLSDDPDLAIKKDIASRVISEISSNLDKQIPRNQEPSPLIG